MEQLVRQLLNLLGRVTGLESVYFTRIDWHDEVQEVVWSHNTGTLVIPEQLTVPLAGTVCRRALDWEPSYTTAVSEVYGDVEAARAPGLQTYLMVPVKTPQGGVFGTVCGVSDHVVEVSDDVRAVMDTFAQVITLHLSVEATARQLRKANDMLEGLALLDPLTGIGNRRALDRDLARVCSQARRRGEPPVGVLAVDVDCFKAINDTHGHAAGDAVLRMVADQLQRRSRSGDIVLRPGGDEFVVLLPGASGDTVRLVGERILGFVAATPVDIGRVAVTTTVSIGGTSGAPADATTMLDGADRALYLAKRRGRNCFHDAGGV